MAMIAGTVTIDPSTGAVSTATGMAASIFLADIDSMPPEWMPSYTLGQTTAPFTPARPANQHDVDAGFSATVAMLTETARKATAYAAGIVGYIQANAKATITTGTSCGVLPTTIAPGYHIDPPVAAVPLSIS